MSRRQAVEVPPAPAPPPAFDPNEGMRHTYTAQLAPYCRELMVNLCAALIEVHDEAQLESDSDPRPIVCNVDAATKDLHFLADWLEYAGNKDVEERWEYRLGELALRLAPQVREIAGEMDAALGAAAGETDR